MPQGRAVLSGDLIPQDLEWLKRENASVFDSNLTKAVREIANRLGAMDPMTYLVGLLGTEIPSAGELGGIAGALGRLMEKAGPKPLQRIANPIIAHHGSPHDFAPVNLIELADGTRLYQNLHELPTMPQGATLIEHYPMGRFDMSKIGTGEGAQAYGHGLYFAENEGTAQTYKLAGGSRFITKGGESTYPAELSERLWKESGHADDPDFLRGIMDAVHEFSVSGGAQRPKAPKDLTSWVGYGPMSQREGYAYAANQLRNVTASPGRMYEVAIHADPESFLDWDKPLSQQSEAVQKAVSGFNQPNVLQDRMKLAGGGELRVVDDPDFGRKYFMEIGGSRFRLSDSDVANLIGTGEQGKSVYQQMTTQLGSEPAASERLKQAGIPGIKYLDQGSRASGQGTRNYVVFDDALIEIRKKWGIAIAAGVEEALRHQANQQNGAVASDDLDAAIGLQTRRPREVGTVSNY